MQGSSTCGLRRFFWGSPKILFNHVAAQFMRHIVAKHCTRHCLASKRLDEVRDRRRAIVDYLVCREIILVCSSLWFVAGVVVFHKQIFPFVRFESVKMEKNRAAKSVNLL